MLAVPTIPCWGVPGASEVPDTTQTSFWPFWQSLVRPGFLAAGSSLFPSLIALPVPDTELCAARAPSGSRLQPCREVLEAFCTTQVPLSHRQDWEEMRISKNLNNNHKNNKNIQ